MHIALLNQYYWPHGSATAQLLTELGEGLAARGHRVTAVTARVAGASGLTPLAQERGGVAIARVPATRRGKGRLADRLLDYGTFFVGAFARLMTLRPAPDVVLALTTPPLIAATAQLAGLMRRFPTVCVVQDVYPDIAVALGVIPEGGGIARAWRLATRASLRAAAHVVALSEPMRARIAAFGVPDERLAVIPNWALAELDSQASGDAMRLRYGFGDRFVVMYSGNMGAGHDFDALLGAAERLAGRDDVVFAFVGDGVRRAEIAAASVRLPNVRLFDYAPRELLAESLAAADLHAVTMRDGMEGLLMPSKVYGAFAAARPVLFVGPDASSVATLVRDAQCGAVVSRGGAPAVARAIEALAATPDRGRDAGARARRYLDEHLGREPAIDRYEALLAASCAVGARSSRSPAVSVRRGSDDARVRS